MRLLQPGSTLFPYTTLFRSSVRQGDIYDLPLGNDTFDAVIIHQVLHFLDDRSEEHTSELQSQSNLVCRLLLEKKDPAAWEMPRAETVCPRAARVHRQRTQLN